LGWFGLVLVDALMRGQGGIGEIKEQEK